MIKVQFMYLLGFFLGCILGLIIGYIVGKTKIEKRFANVSKEVIENEE